MRFSEAPRSYEYQQDLCVWVTHLEILPQFSLSHKFSLGGSCTVAYAQVHVRRAGGKAEERHTVRWCQCSSYTKQRRAEVCSSCSRAFIQFTQCPHFTPHCSEIKRPGPVFLEQTAEIGNIFDFIQAKKTLTISNLSSVAFYRNKTCAPMIHNRISKHCKCCFSAAPPSCVANVCRAVVTLSCWPRAVGPRQLQTSAWDTAHCWLSSAMRRARPDAHPDLLQAAISFAALFQDVSGSLAAA